MKRTLASLALVGFLATPAFAADKTYQVTGPVVQVTGDAITVKKGSENWTLAIDAGTKKSGDVKVGDKVTVTYKMTATSIEAKAAGGGKKK